MQSQSALLNPCTGDFWNLFSETEHSSRELITISDLQDKDQEAYAHTSVI